jgi:hypothetical protein
MKGISAEDGTSPWLSGDWVTLIRAAVFTGPRGTGITYDELSGSGIGETGLGERSVAISNGTKTAPAST